MTDGFLNGLRLRLAAATPRTRLILILVLTGLGATHCAPATWNDESRMATIQSLVEQGSFVIDDTAFISTGDKVFIDGHFYSDKPPMPSILGAAVYWPLYHLGLRLHGGTSISYFLITLCTVTLSWLIGTLAFFESLKIGGLGAERRLLAAIALGMGTIYLSWSTTFNNHELAASCLAIGFYYFLRARQASPVGGRHQEFATGRHLAMRRDLALSGLFLSLAGACDNPTAIFFVLFLLTALADVRLRGKALYFLGPLLVTVVPMLAVNHAIHHHITPVQIYPAYFDYPGSPWQGSDPLSGVSRNTLPTAAHYALLTLLGPRGFLLYDPFLIVALWYLARTLRQRGPFFGEAACVASGCLIIALYYWFETRNFGDWSYSIRWFVPLLPLLMFFAHPWFASEDRRRNVLIHALLAVSVVIALVGALNPWSPVIYSDISFVANIEQFVAHLQRPPRPPGRAP